MFNSLRNKKGMSIVEAVIAAFITTVAIIAVGMMQPLALRTEASSDRMGTAVAIAQAQAADIEAAIMTAGGAVPANLTAWQYSVQNITYTIDTVTTNPAANLWLVSVQVTWSGPGGTVKSVTHYRAVTQQMGY